MNRIGVLVLLGLSLGTQARASFDLSLIPGADGRVYRYDPVNQVQLGSFAAGASIQAIAVDPTRHRSLVMRGTSSELYDFSTGERLSAAPGVTSGSSAYYSSTQNRYNINYAGASNFFDFADAVTGAYVYGPLYGTGFAQGRRLDDSTAYGMSVIGTGMRFSRLNSSLSVVGTFDTTMSGTLIASPIVSYGGQLYTAINSSTGTTTVFNVLGTATTVTPSARFSVTGFDSSKRVFLTPSHYGLYAFGKDTASANWRVVEYLYTGSAFYAQTTNVLAIGYVDASPDTFLAPEPGSLAALGVGFIALLRRRRR